MCNDLSRRPSESPNGHTRVLARADQEVVVRVPDVDRQGRDVHGDCEGEATCHYQGRPCTRISLGKFIKYKIVV